MGCADRPGHRVGSTRNVTRKRDLWRNSSEETWVSIVVGFFSLTAATLFAVAEPLIQVGGT